MYTGISLLYMYVYVCMYILYVCIYSIYMYICMYTVYVYMCVYLQFSHSVMSDSLWPHEPRHTRPPCPSPAPGVDPHPCPSSRWCHPIISSSVVPFSSCLNLSQHQGLLKWVSSSHQVAKVLEFQHQLPNAELLMTDQLSLSYIFIIIGLLNSPLICNFHLKYFKFAFRNALFWTVLLNCGVGEDSWESLGLQGDPTSPS